MTPQTKIKETDIPDVWFELITGLYNLRPIHTKNMKQR